MTVTAEKEVPCTLVNTTRRSVFISMKRAVMSDAWVIVRKQRILEDNRGRAAKMVLAGLANELHPMPITLEPFWLDVL
jgi:hypothetical protein